MDNNTRDCYHNFQYNYVHLIYIIKCNNFHFLNINLFYNYNTFLNLFLLFLNMYLMDNLLCHYHKVYIIQNHLHNKQYKIYIYMYYYLNNIFCYQYRPIPIQNRFHCHLCIKQYILYTQYYVKYKDIYHLSHHIHYFSCNTSYYQSYLNNTYTCHYKYMKLNHLR